MKKARLLKPGHAEVVYVKKEDASGAIRQYHMRELDGKYLHSGVLFNLSWVCYISFDYL